MLAVKCSQRGEITPGLISSFLAFGSYGSVGIR